MEHTLEQNNKIVVLENGPYLMEGKFTFIDHTGSETSKEGKVALCRCGLSASKPFCDGTHRRNEWKS
ncbi:MAG TPA: iron-binding protein [Bacteroidetes bacterium]|nr:iron-binding protein [Bacteroidota bacterium]